MMPPTSPPAMMAPAASKTAAMQITIVMVMAIDPTAGPTSLAPMFIAM